MEQELQVQEMAIAPQEHRLTSRGLIEHINLIKEIMDKVLVTGVHYGLVPGCGDKPSLFKAGAEKIAMAFRLSPTFKITKTDFGEGHREYEVVCSLTHAISGVFLGEGVGSCSTMESKYAYRKGSRKCPQCKAEAIIKGKDEYGGGWLCYGKKGGCGAKFPDGDESIEKQSSDRVANVDLADQYNTILKMAKKRAQVDATLTATGTSDILTQDLEDLKPDIIGGDRPRDENNGSMMPKGRSENPNPNYSNGNGNGNTHHPYENRSGATQGSTQGKTAPQNGNKAGDTRTISQPQENRFWAIASKNGVNEERVSDYIFTEFGIAHPNQMLRQDYDKACAWAEGKGRNVERDPGMDG